MNNLIVFEKPLIIIHDFSFSVKNVRSPLHEVKTEKKSWSVEKQAGFKLHVTLVCYKLLQVCSVFYLAKNTNGALGGFFYHLFSIIYAFLTFCCTFCENFRKARKNIPVFKNDSQRLFKIIIISISFEFTLLRAMPVNTNLHIYKNSCDSSKDRLDTKILSQFSKLPDKNLLLVLFYHLKT